MRVETKVIQVANDQKVINKVSQEAAIWGWAVQNIQITEQKIVKEGDSHERESFFGDKIITETEVITEHINYATITFQRDRDDLTMSKLAELELAYEAADRAMLLNDNEQYEVEELGKILDKRDLDKRIAKYLLIGAGIAFVLGLFGVARTLMEVLLFGCLAGAIFFYGKAIFKREYRICQRNYDNHMKNLSIARIRRKEEILAQAKDILTGK